MQLPDALFYWLNQYQSQPMLLMDEEALPEMGFEQLLWPAPLLLEEDLTMPRQPNPETDDPEPLGEKPKEPRQRKMIPQLPLLTKQERSEPAIQGQVTEPKQVKRIEIRIPNQIATKPEPQPTTARDQNEVPKLEIPLSPVSVAREKTPVATKHPDINPVQIQKTETPALEHQPLPVSQPISRPMPLDIPELELPKVDLPKPVITPKASRITKEPTQPQPTLALAEPTPTKIASPKLEHRVTQLSELLVPFKLEIHQPVERVLPVPKTQGDVILQSFEPPAPVEVPKVSMTLDQGPLNGTKVIATQTEQGTEIQLKLPADQQVFKTIEVPKVQAMLTERLGADVKLITTPLETLTKSKTQTLPRPRRKRGKS